MSGRLHILVTFFLSLMGSLLMAHQPDGPIFGNDGETVVYYVSRDAKGRQGTVSDALQNVPGVKVDTEGNISLRGVSEVEVFINGKPAARVGDALNAHNGTGKVNAGSGDVYIGG